VAEIVRVMRMETAFAMMQRSPDVRTKKLATTTRRPPMKMVAVSMQQKAMTARATPS